MRSITIVAILAAVAAAPAFAWSEGPYANPEFQPTRPTMATWAYPAQNYCPSGLQPIMAGGVICCGVPTHADLSRHPAPRPAYHAHTYGGAKDGFVAYSKEYTGN